MKYILLCLKKYFSIKGCASKKEVAYYGVFLIALMVIIFVLGFGVFQDNSFVFSILLTIFMLFVLPLLSASVRRMHAMGRSGWAAMFTPFMWFGNRKDIEGENPYETKSEPGLQFFVVVIDIVLFLFMFRNVIDSIPYSEWVVKAEVNGKTVKIVSAEIWDDKIVYMADDSESTFFDGEKSIRNVTNYYISRDEKNLAYMKIPPEQNYELDENGNRVEAEDDFYDYRREQLYVNGELIEERAGIYNFAFSDDSSHYCYIRKNGNIFEDLYVDGKPSGIFDYEKKLKISSTKRLDTMSILNAGFIGETNDVYAEILVNREQNILWYGNQRIENIWSVEYRSDDGKNFLYYTRDKDKKFILNVLTPDFRKTYGPVKSPCILYHTKYLSHIAYADLDYDNERWTLFIDGKWIRRMDFPDDDYWFFSRDWIPVKGFGLTDDGNNYAYYINDKESDCEILYLNGKEYGKFYSIVSIRNDGIGYNISNEPCIRSTANGDYLIWVKKLTGGDDYIINKKGMFRLEELYESTDALFDSSEPEVITKWNDGLITFEYDSKTYGSFNFGTKDLGATVYSPEADSIEFEVRNSRGSRRYVFVDGEAFPGLIFHDKILYVKDKELLVHKK